MFLVIQGGKSFPDLIDQSLSCYRLMEVMLKILGQSVISRTAFSMHSSFGERTISDKLFHNYM